MDAILIDFVPVPVSKVLNRATKVSLPPSSGLMPRWEPNMRGEGFFAGIITQNNRPARARVEVWDNVTNSLVKYTMSEIDGTFVVEGLNPLREYTIVAIDPEGEWEHKVSSRRYPRTTL